MSIQQYFNAKTGRYICPRDGCYCTFKSLKTLNNHFNLKHPRGDKPVWIVEGIDRQADKKYEATKANKRQLNTVAGISWLEFKTQKWAEVKTANPGMKFGDVNKQISTMWKEFKAANTTEINIVTIPLVEPTVEEPKKPIKMSAEDFASWVSNVTDYFAQSGVEVEMSHVDGGVSAKVVETVETTETDEVEVETTETDETADETTETADETGYETDETTYDVKADYDEVLVECCKTWLDGGFVKAYRKMQGELDMVLEKSGKTTKKVIEGTFVNSLLMHRHGKKTKVTIGDVLTELEEVFVSLCDAWYDYCRSEDFNECDAYLFDDDARWCDISYKVFNDETMSHFLG